MIQKAINHIVWQKKYETTINKLSALRNERVVFLNDGEYLELMFRE